MVGLGAPDELIEQVNTVTQEHHAAMQVGGWRCVIAVKCK